MGIVKSGDIMCLTAKMAGYILYAVGIIGGVEGATMKAEFGTQLAIITSVIALIVIAIGAYLIDKK